MMPAVERFEYDLVDSTNEVAKRLIAEGRISERALVCARGQTAGKGTRGRRWLSPRDAGIYFSLVQCCTARPRIPTPEYTLAAAVGCVEALAETVGVAVRLKPINDLYADGRKLGGILVETTIQNGQMTALITGVGINVRRADRPLPEGEVSAACLEELMPPEAFRALDTNRLVSAMVDRIVEWHAKVAVGELDEVKRAWDGHALSGNASTAP